MSHTAQPKPDSPHQPQIQHALAGEEQREVNMASSEKLLTSGQHKVIRELQQDLRGLKLRTAQ